MSQQIQISGGAKVRDLQDVIIGTSGVLSSLAFNVANGVPKLDSNGKILVAQLPNSVMEYLGTWNAATNTPTLTNGGAFNQGDVFLCTTAGTVNFGSGAPITFAVGDSAIYSSVAEGSVWQKSGGATGTVTSVAVTESGDSLNITGSPITTSGTINIGFNGTNLQYVNGAGNLTTFPILTGYVPYTGATQDVDLDTFKLNAQSLHIKGTAGNGHLGLKHQSASATASANEVSLFADSLGDLSWLNGNLYLSKFIISSNTAARSYTFPNANGTVALTSDLANYVDLTTAQTIGGTKTFSDATKNNGGIFLQNASSNSLAGYMNIGGLTNGVKFTSGGGVSNNFTLPSATGYTFTFPNATGTIALTSDISYPVTSVFGRTGAVVATSGDYTTTLVTEGTNLYYTQARFDTAFAAKSTTNLTEGTNLYFTNARAIASTLTGYVSGAGTISATDTILSAIQKLNGNIGALTTGVSSVFGRTGAVVATSGDYTTTQVTEGTNLYYTDVRARSALSFVAGSGAYNSTTGVITIPTNNNQITNGAGYTTNVGTVTSVAATGGTGISITGSPITTSGTITITNTAPDQTVALTASTGISVTGTYPNFTITNTSPSSGGTVTSVAALTIGTTGTDLSSSVATGTTTPVITLNVPTASAANRGALSSADWTTFNNKQSALTNPVTGTGTTNYLPKFTGTSTIGDSQIFDNGTNVGIGEANPTSKLHIQSSAAGGQNLRIQTSVAAGRNYLQWANGSGDMGYIGYGGADGKFYIVNQLNDEMLFYTNSTKQMTLSSSGNLGLGVTPTTLDAGGVNLQIKDRSAFFQLAAVNSTYLSNNIYYDGSWKRIVSGYGTMIRLTDDNNGFSFLTTGTGGANSAVTFTSAMAITNGGNVLIGTTTDNGNAKVQINGALQVQGFFNSTSASTGGIDYSGGGTRFFSVGTSGSTKGLFTFIAKGADDSSITPLTIASTGAATFSSSVQGTSFSNAGLQASEVFNATKSNAGYYVGYFQNTSATGLGLYIRNGLDTNSSIRISNASGTANTIELFGSGAATFSGALNGTSATFSDQLIASSTSGGTAAIFRNTGVQNNNGFELRGGTTGTTVNWKFEKDNTVSNAFQLTPSTTNGGTTYTTPVLTIASTGAASFSSTIQTGTPSGGTAKPWKLGQDTNTYYAPTRTIQVEIDGGTYYLLAVKSTDL